MSRSVRDAVEAVLATHPAGVLPIVHAGDPVLRTPAEPYDGQLEELFGPFLDAMRRTMLAAPGVGLAAPQVGVGLALAVVHDVGVLVPEEDDPRERSPLDHRVLVNPAYEGVGDVQRSFYEGCLSVPGYQAVVGRHRTVHLTGSDETGRALDEELVGWPARIIQHETDHLRGRLYLDRAELRSLSSNENLVRHWAQDADPARAAGRMTFHVH